MLIEIFLADDHAVMRDGLRLLLETQPDLRVVGEAATGREAVHLLSLYCPDVLIMDIAMSDLNGIDATLQVRAQCPHIQVVMLSMYSSQEHIARALQAGAIGYVLKESAGVDVVAAVRAAHAGRQYLSPKIAVALADMRHLDVSPLDLLSVREREILQLMVEGRSSVEIGAVLMLSPKTIETYRSRLMRKLGFRDLPSLVKFAIRHGLIAPE
jgi:DNA-binding NarL/FixJ family response regulator